MIVLSLFDGMSCGKIALDRLGIKDVTYYASEVDKNAIKVSKSNHDDIIQIGDVTKVRYEGGVLYTENGNFNIGKIDLLIGGSPCQDFSTLRSFNCTGAKSKGLSGEKSSLFYEYLRIKEECSPEYWMLENVKMKSDSKKQLDDYLAVDGVLINSSLVSFQRRARYYWTNIKFTVPEDLQVSYQDFKDTGDLSEYKVNRTPSRERMWSDGKGTGSRSCKNVTHADKIYCLTKSQDRAPNSGLVAYEDFCRYLSRKELELAQTVPVGYTDVLSYPQASAVLGNGWTVDVICKVLERLTDIYK